MILTDAAVDLRGERIKPVWLPLCEDTIVPLL